MKKTVFQAAFAFAALFATSAHAVDYKFAFEGSGGYSLAGVLSFDDALLNTGVINETQISDLAIEVFQNGVSVGTRSLLGEGLGSQASFFNLNFDTVAGQFAVGGPSTGPTGQSFFSRAGADCDTVGFGSGSVGQGVCVDGAFVGFVPLDEATLTASLINVNPTPGAGPIPAPAPAPVPLPASGWVLLAGLGGLIAMRRKRLA